MNADAVIQELAMQRMILGDRAAQLASALADANEQIKTLAVQITELKEQLREKERPTT